MNPEINQRQLELEALCRRFYVRRLELFGSAAAGRDIPGKSDFDFLVEFEPLPRGAYADNYFGLLEALVALFDRPVDLVVATAIRNPYFLQSISQTKALLYAAWDEQYLFDIQRAVMLLTQFTAGKTFDDYVREAMLRAAVEREFEIVGEALAHSQN